MLKAPSQSLQKRNIDRFLPDFHFTERHHRDIPAAPAATYYAARRLDFSESTISRLLFKIRGLHANALTIDAMTEIGGFTIIDEQPPHEFVIGHASTGTRAIAIQDGDHFATLKPTNGVKIAWNFHTEPLDDNLTRLHTETRTICYGKPAKILFRAYWLAIRPFSGLIRKEMLKSVRPEPPA